MYAFLWLYEKGEINGNITEYYNAARNKPQVLSEEFSRKYFNGLISDEASQKQSAKAFLTTGQNIPGLGNGVLQDILFNAGIHPKTKISHLSATIRNTLYDALKGTMNDILAKSDRISETDIFGNHGKYISYLSKYTEGEKCPRCGGIIVKENYLGGSIYYYTGCQKK